MSMADNRRRGEAVLWGRLPAFQGKVLSTGRRRWAGTAVLAASVLVGPATHAGTVESTRPYWFQDQYLDTSKVRTCVNP